MHNIESLTVNVLIVLGAGLIAGTICKRIGVSMLVGYLVVGALIGGGVLNLVNQQDHELEVLAQFGALLLLFAVGLEFSLEELMRLSRYSMIGGATQMFLVAVPLTGVCMAFGMSLNAAVLAGFAGALSSTVLVFKALAEWGLTASPHGRRAIAILLFQDVALVPLMLLVPLLTHQGEPPTITTYLLLALKSSIFLAALLACRSVVGRWIVPSLAGLRSVELVMLFTLCLLGGVCWSAFQLGLPSAVGALAAGIILSGNRLSRQVDSIVLPFRESFSVIFFVTIGTLLDPSMFFQEPLLLTAGLIGMLVLKSGAASIALKVVGLQWKTAFGMGLGLAQLGEFSFLLISEAAGLGLISRDDYNRMLFIALGTLILTPQLIRYGLRWTERSPDEDLHGMQHRRDSAVSRHAIVIGIGLIGRQLASRLEIMGSEVRLVDQSPINLHGFAQQGFHTTAGDARDPDILHRAGAENCGLCIVSVPSDDAALQIVTALRGINHDAEIIVRCRYQGNVHRIMKAGAAAVVSEEAEASKAMLQWCDRAVGPIE
ncbi:cation:proton antiporter [Rosistilla oblonga]|uniref:cation:proton antiporter domain-containing protein n=1 Tax=Rosistilla oblonga TaxID=2527990 RepID=UPI003A97318B